MCVCVHAVRGCVLALGRNYSVPLFCGAFICLLMLFWTQRHLESIPGLRVTSWWSGEYSQSGETPGSDHWKGKCSGIIDSHTNSFVSRTPVSESITLQLVRDYRCNNFQLLSDVVLTELFPCISVWITLALFCVNPLGPWPATALSLQNPMWREVTVSNDPGIQLKNQ